MLSGAPLLTYTSMSFVLQAADAWHLFRSSQLCFHFLKVSSCLVNVGGVNERDTQALF